MKPPSIFGCLFLQTTQRFQYEKFLKSQIFWLPCLSLFVANVAIAQPIVPENNSTGTTVTPQGNQYNIGGGRTSGDGANLFHSFTRFNVPENQTANFLSNPHLRNILGRINGGDASYINGLIQVIGGNSNLFLMNPAGIVFGNNASLNVPASFNATTANRIGFDAGWFDATGVNNYAGLIGTPSAFSFTTTQPASLLNFADLTVPNGNLSLSAGTVINTGRLNATTGDINITTVPGNHTLKISQEGHLLSLEVAAQSNSENLTPIALPELLTGTLGQNASEIIVNSDGSITLAGSGIQIKNGDILIQNSLHSENTTLATSHNLTLIPSNLSNSTGLQLSTTGNLNLLAGNTVTIRDNFTHSFLANAGNNLYIQGNQNIDIWALNHPQTPFQSGGNMTFVTDGNFSGDAHFATGRQFSVLNLSGLPGQFLSWNDPIISSTGDVLFGDYTGVSLKIESGGSISGGNITITGADTTLSGSDPDISILTSSAALILRAGVNELQNPANTNPITLSGGTAFVSPGFSTGGNIAVQTVETAGGPVIFSSLGDIVSGNIITNGGAINFNSNAAITLVGSLNSSSNIGAAGGLISLASTGDLTTRDIINSGGEINLRSQSKIITNGSLNSSSNIGTAGKVNLQARDLLQLLEINASSTAGSGGNVSLTSDTATVKTGTLNTAGTTGGGNVDVKASQEVEIITVNTSASNGKGGNFTSESTNSTINLGNINTSGNDGGAISFNAEQDIILTTLLSRGKIGAGGNIFLRSNAGNIETNDINASGVQLAGKVTLNAALEILAGNINAASEAGTGNTVTLNATDITLSTINTQGSTTGGIIDITTDRFFRATGTLTAADNNTASLSSIGGTTGGNITLRHAGGTTTPFIIGDATTNGTAGRIVTGSSAISPIFNVPVPYPTGTYTRGNIQIITTPPAPPPPTPEPTPTPAPQPTPTPTPQPQPTPGKTPTPTPGNTPTPTPTPTPQPTPGNTPTPTPTSFPDISDLDPEIFNNPDIFNNPEIFKNPTLISNPKIIQNIAKNLALTSNSETLSNLLNNSAVADNKEIVSQILNNPKILENPQVLINKNILSNSTLRNTLDQVVDAQPDSIKQVIQSNILSPTTVFPSTFTFGDIDAFKKIQISRDITWPQLDLWQYYKEFGELIQPANQINLFLSQETTEKVLTAVLPKATLRRQIWSLVTNSDSIPINFEFENQWGKLVTFNNIQFSLLPPDSTEVDRLSILTPNYTSPVDINAFLNTDPENTNPDSNLSFSLIKADGTNGTNGTEELAIPLGANISRPESIVPRIFSSGGGIIIPQPAEPTTTLSSSPVASVPAQITVSSGEKKGAEILPASAISEINQAISRGISTPFTTALAQGNIEQAVAIIEQERTSEYEEYLDEKFVSKTVTPQTIRETLTQITEQTGTKPVMVYAVVQPDRLELLLIPPEGQAIRHSVPEAARETLLALVNDFRIELTSPRRQISTKYLKKAQQLYNWIIAPLEQDLQALKIDTLVFSLDAGLRSLPLAALHDGKQFLVEKYSLGVVPSLSLTDTQYQTTKDSKLLAMGASRFRELAPLPAVPVELQTILQNRAGETFLNENFTLANFQSQRNSQEFKLIHLATHSEFISENINNSYIQLWDKKLHFNELRKLRLNEPQVELIVLSACRTAFGNERAELGFAGLSVQTGAKSALASLWYVSDAGTLALMSEFYRHLNTAPIKAEALRQAQIAMIRGQVRLENGQLQLRQVAQNFPLPVEVARIGNLSLSHPYYWSAFTMIGSPW